MLHVGGYVLHLKRHTREMDSAWMGTDVMDILFLSSRLVYITKTNQKTSKQGQLLFIGRGARRDEKTTEPTNQSEIRRRENESCHGITQEIKVNIFFFLSMKMRESSVFRLSLFSFPSLRRCVQQREAKLRTIIPTHAKKKRKNVRLDIRVCYFAHCLFLVPTERERKDCSETTSGSIPASEEKIATALAAGTGGCVGLTG